MLAEIDKDARAIAALQEENKALKLRMDQMQLMLDQWTLKINDLLKEEPLGLEENEPHDEIVFEPFDEIRGRKLYRVTRNFIAGRTLRLIRVFQCRGDYTFYILTDGILSRQWNDTSLNDHFKCDVMATVYCKGDHVQGSSCGIMNTYNPDNIFDLIESL
jgi:hypothetical protein